MENMGIDKAAILATRIDSLLHSGATDDDTSADTSAEDLGIRDWYRSGRVNDYSTAGAGQIFLMF